jgi:hypothetical protein
MYFDYFHYYFFLTSLIYNVKYCYKLLYQKKNIVINYGTIQNKIDISNKLLKSSEKYFILNFIIRVNNKTFKERKINFLNDNLKFF